MDSPHERLERERLELQKTLLRESRRSHFWRAAVVGLLAGLAAVLFQFALEGAEKLREAFVWGFQAVGPFGVVATVVFSSLLAGAAGYLTSQYAPEAAGSGIPHTKAVLLNLRQLRWLPVTVIKFVGGFLALGAGLSLGREGPTVHIGACIGKGLSEKLRVPKRSHRTLIASGAGAGLAAAFNAPLSGFLFVIEEMQREMTPVTYGAALIAAVVADAVTQLVIGHHPAFRITGYDAPAMALLPLVALLGALAGVLGVFLNRSLLRAGQIMQGWNWRKSLAVGAVAGLAVWFMPAIAGGGHHTAEIVASGDLAVMASPLRYLFLLLIGKYLLTLLSYGAGVPGGVFAPMLAMGAFLGLTFGQISRLVFPDAGINSAAFAVLGMAALLTGSVRTPLTSIVLVLEMTHNFEQLYALIVASLVAYLVAEGFRDRPLYEALLEHDLQKPTPAGGVEPDPILLELYVEASSFLDNCQVQDIPLPEGCVIVSVLRGKNEFAPPDKFHIHAGDVVVFLVEGNNPRLGRALLHLARS